MASETPILGTGGGDEAKSALTGGSKGKTAARNGRRPKWSSSGGIQTTPLVRMMNTYSITGQELLLFGLTNGLGASALGWAVFFQQKADELASRPQHDPEFLAYCYSMVHLGIILAVVLYIVFGLVIWKIKWSSGQRNWRQFFLGEPIDEQGEVPKS